MRIHVSITEQALRLYQGADLVREYSVSTALNGVGNEKNSGQTPLGKHLIRAKIGTDLPSGAVLVGRRWTGEVLTEDLQRSAPQRDWILSRILWLSGIEIGFNRLGNCDTMQRYIYIHGTPDSEPMGVPLSHGCIRMRNHDVIDLFDRVEPFTEVSIELN
ncbi:MULTISPECIES: L,D-transpeptidase [Thiomicrorhabdus]|uniref:L,D-transpeptidase n=1 Tax=Thiomicrorhabdus heinhorstiae TaxID=2748010 RepID=A0ABS0BUL8_9GAMM|nr:MULTISPECIES: L,D-transpeptidase [Thiomicrorhabdus]MBF6056795.1 L,D-transpeptidase [Thiomicrorhabdus heinhorstiae]